jgi:hypothetical protein
MLRFELIAAPLLAIAAVSVTTTGPAFAQATGSIAFGGSVVSRPQFQYPATSLLSGAPSYGPSMMTRAMGSNPDVMPIPSRDVGRWNRSAQSPGFDGTSVLDDEALAGVR